MEEFKHNPSMLLSLHKSWIEERGGGGASSSNTTKIQIQFERTLRNPYFFWTWLSDYQTRLQ